MFHIMEELIHSDTQTLKALRKILGQALPLYAQGLKLSVGVCSVGQNQRFVRGNGLLGKCLQPQSTNMA